MGRIQSPFGAAVIQRWVNRAPQKIHSLAVRYDAGTWVSKNNHIVVRPKASWVDLICRTHQHDRRRDCECENTWTVWTTESRESFNNFWRTYD